MQWLVEYDTKANMITNKHFVESVNIATTSYFGNDPLLAESNIVESVSPHIAISPDKTHTAMVDNNIRTNIYVLNMQTQKVVNVTNSYNLNQSFDSPTWSEDGKWLAMRRLRLHKYDFWEIVGYDIAILNMDTEEPDLNSKTIYQSNQPLICPNELFIK